MHGRTDFGPLKYNLECCQFHNEEVKVAVDGLLQMSKFSFCRDGTNASVSMGVMLKNNYISVV
jgi:hypothetical protein